MLNTDLKEGLPLPDHRFICRRKPSQACQPYQLLAAIVHSLTKVLVTIILLLVAAVLALGFGLKEYGCHPRGWLSGVILFFTAFVVFLSTTIKTCWEYWQNKKLENSWRSEGRNMLVDIVRQGKTIRVSEGDLEVGDIVIMERLAHVPADGLFVGRGSLQIDEGLSKPTTVDEGNPFLLYGTRVINGCQENEDRMLVTAVRMETEWGERMGQAMQEAAEKECPFESRLHKWSSWVHNTGLILAILILIVVFIRFVIFQKVENKSQYRPDSRGEPARVPTTMNAIKEVLTESRGRFLRVTTLLSVSLIGISEAMPFFISYAIMKWSRNILAHKAVQRDNVACLKMAHVTTICTDKHEGLTEGETEIDKFYMGGDFVSESTSLPPKVLDCLLDGIGILSQLELQSHCILALNSWATARLGLKSESMVEQCKIIIDTPKGRNPFQESCDITIKKNGQDGCFLIRTLIGPLDAILPLCSHRYDIYGNEQKMDKKMMSDLSEFHRRMEDEDAQVITHACRRLDARSEATPADQPSNLIFVGMISLKETKAEDTKQVLSTLKKSEIETILVSGDDVKELTSIGKNCGIITANPNDGVVLDAEVFRGWNDKEKMDHVKDIRIMGKCTLSDKADLINCLRKKDKVVAFLGQRMMDAPVLKQADVGIAIGKRSSTAAMECSDIAISDSDYLSFLAYAIKEARIFQENIFKLVQQVLILTCSSLLINSVATVLLGGVSMNALQLFWLNTSVTLCGGLALLTGTSNEALRSLQVTEKAMWINIAVQVVYLTSIFAGLQCRGKAIPIPIMKGISEDGLKSMVYNGVFLCQIFITLICREVKKKNILRGVVISCDDKTKWFWVGLSLLLICVAVSAGVEKVVGGVSGLSWEQWSICILIGMGCVLMDFVRKILYPI